MTTASTRIPRARFTGRRPLVALALVAALALTGCTAGGGSGGDAAPATTAAPGEPITCANIGGELELLADEVQAGVEQVVNDPQSVVAELAVVGERLADLVERTDDPQLRGHLEAARDAAVEFVDEAGAALSDGDLGARLPDLGAKLTALGDALAGATDHCRGQ